jgi:hypothetical protein
MQVEAGFDRETGDRQPVGSGGGALARHGTLTNFRHRLWVSRGRREAGTLTWRPVPVHRLNAKKWCCALDNQNRVMSEMGGLVYLQRNDTDLMWKDWRRHPHASVVMDLGSDGLSGSNALMYMFLLSLTRIDDFAHGCNCDIRVMLKAVKYWSFWLLMMVCFNVVWGPDHDEGRLHQTRDTMQHLYETETHISCVLFKSMASDIHKEML